MAKQSWKPGNMLYPIPAVMVSCALEGEKPNIITVAWAGNVCSSPAMLSISVRPDRYSHHILKESGEFVVNLVNRKLTRACDWCGVRSGKDYDKFREMHLTPMPMEKVACPGIAESPVNIECKVKQIIPLGSHDLFLAEVVCVDVEEAFLDEKQRLDLRKADLVAYSHGEYFELGEKLGKFGYSVAKKPADSKKPATTKKTAPTKKSTTTKQATANKTVTSKKTVASRKQSMGASQSGAVRRKDQKKK